MNLKPIGSIIKFNSYWENPKGKYSGEIIGYDIFKTKYKIVKHDFTGKKLVGVFEWIFPKK